MSFARYNAHLNICCTRKPIVDLENAASRSTVHRLGRVAWVATCVWVWIGQRARRLTLSTTGGYVRCNEGKRSCQDSKENVTITMTVGTNVRGCWRYAAKVRV